MPSEPTPTAPAKKQTSLNGFFFKLPKDNFPGQQICPNPNDPVRPLNAPNEAGSSGVVAELAKPTPVVQQIKSADAAPKPKPAPKSKATEPRPKAAKAPKPAKAQETVVSPPPTKSTSVKRKVEDDGTGQAAAKHIAVKAKTPTGKTPIPQLPPPQQLLRCLSGEAKPALLMAWQFARAFVEPLKLARPPTLEALYDGLSGDSPAAAVGGVVGALHVALLRVLLDDEDDLVEPPDEEVRRHPPPATLAVARRVVRASPCSPRRTLCAASRSRRAAPQPVSVRPLVIVAAREPRRRWRTLRQRGARCRPAGSASRRSRPAASSTRASLGRAVSRRSRSPRRGA